MVFFEGEVEIPQRIRELCGEGLGYDRIAERLNVKELKARTGGRAWLGQSHLYTHGCLNLRPARLRVSLRLESQPISRVRASIQCLLFVMFWTYGPSLGREDQCLKCYQYLYT